MGSARLIKAEFVEWLRSQKSHSIVGTAEESTNCPLATYCTNELNFDQVRVDTVTLTYWNDNISRWGERMLPPWAKKFVEGVDNSCTEVTAKEALQVLGVERN